MDFTGELDRKRVQLHSSIRRQHTNKVMRDIRSVFIEAMTATTEGYSSDSHAALANLAQTFSHALVDNNPQQLILVMSQIKNNIKNQPDKSLTVLIHSQIPKLLMFLYHNLWYPTLRQHQIRFKEIIIQLLARLSRSAVFNHSVIENLNLIAVLLGDYCRDKPSLRKRMLILFGNLMLEPEVMYVFIQEGVILRLIKEVDIDGNDEVEVEARLMWLLGTHIAVYPELLGAEETYQIRKLSIYIINNHYYYASANQQTLQQAIIALVYIGCSTRIYQDIPFKILIQVSQQYKFKDVSKKALDRIVTLFQVVSRSFNTVVQMIVMSPQFPIFLLDLLFSHTKEVMQIVDNLLGVTDAVSNIREVVISILSRWDNEDQTDQLDVKFSILFRYFAQHNYLVQREDQMEILKKLSLKCRPRCNYIQSEQLFWRYLVRAGYQGPVPDIVSA